MAMEMNLIISGLSIQNAYIKIDSLILDNESKTASGSLCVKQTKDSEKLPFREGFSFSHIAVNDSFDVRKQVYEKLIQTEKYKTAVYVE